MSAWPCSDAFDTPWPTERHTEATMIGASDCAKALSVMQATSNTNVNGMMTGRPFRSTRRPENGRTSTISVDEMRKKTH